MIEKLEERKDKEKQAISKYGNGDRKVSDQDFFRQLGNKIKVTKK